MIIAGLRVKLPVLFSLGTETTTPGSLRSLAAEAGSRENGVLENFGSSVIRLSAADQSHPPLDMATPGRKGETAAEQEVLSDLLTTPSK